MTAVLLFFVLGVSNGRSRFSSSEVNDVDVDAENVTSPGKFTDCDVTCHSLLHPSGMIEQLKSRERTRGDCIDKKSTFFVYIARLIFSPNSRKLNSSSTYFLRQDILQIKGNVNVFPFHVDHVKNQPFTENFINSFSDISCIFIVRKSLFEYDENFGEKAC